MLAEAMVLEPDRLLLIDCATLSPQQRIWRRLAPSEDPAAQCLQQTVRRLRTAGYGYAGMDRYARRPGGVDRGLYSEGDRLGLGPGALGYVAGGYLQNRPSPEDYRAALDAGRLPLWRGLRPDPDDRLRRALIGELRARGRLNFAALEDRYAVRFADYFAPELQHLEHLALDGLLDLWVDRLVLRPEGWLQVHRLCRVFDRHAGDAARLATTRRRLAVPA